MKATEIFNLCKSLPEGALRSLQKDSGKLYFKFLSQMRKMDQAEQDILMRLVKNKKQYLNTLNYCLVKLLEMIPGENALAKIKSVTAAAAYKTAQKLLKEEFSKQHRLSVMYGMACFRDEFEHLYKFEIGGPSTSEIVRQINILEEVKELNTLCRKVTRADREQKEMVKARVLAYHENWNGKSVWPEVKLAFQKSKYMLCALDLDFGAALERQKVLLKMIEEHFDLVSQDEWLIEMYLLANLLTEKEDYLETNKILWQINATKAQSRSAGDLISRFHTSQGLILALKTGNLSLGERCCTELLANEALFKDKLRRFQYYAALFYFSAGNFDQSLVMLRRMRDQLSGRNKFGMTWQPLLLEMLCWFELGDEEMVEIFARKILRKNWTVEYPKVWAKMIRSLPKGKEGPDPDSYFKTKSEAEKYASAFLSWVYWFEARALGITVLELLKRQQLSSDQKFQQWLHARHA